ncbi:probable arabinosyltransferase ARAD1 [Phragmites australis]|uniref:probable arabinosyltransferase ARAD1 n=1 Tax=Phragmites australis TaxID=29695 RepID=UPI002D7915AC|nr:probable arabinosyltransferase ARAD1 [Phragmites australis]
MKQLAVPILLLLLSLSFILLLLRPTSPPLVPWQAPNPDRRLRVYVAALPRALNYGLLDRYWSLPAADSRIPASSDPDHPAPHNHPPYPDNPLIKQYSAEYWLLASLQSASAGAAVRKVADWREADVVFVPFFATLSAEMELGWGAKGAFRKKDGNDDYRRQREVVDRVTAHPAWRRSGGRDHIFVLTDPVAMWHVQAEIAPAILLVVDFGGWYKLDSKSASRNSSHMIQHTEVSLLKDVIVPYTHLLPTLRLSENKDRPTLLYFKGARHRHRGGLVREKLWDLLGSEPDVVMEEGFPNATGREQSIKGMRTSEFCLHPAGDTPTSCRLFDAIASICIPVIVSDEVELPFEGMIDYTEFSIFVSVSNALRSEWLTNYLRNISKQRKDEFRRNLAHVQPIFEYDTSYSSSTGTAPPDGAVNYIWKKIHQKLPKIQEAVIREKRKPDGASIPLRCHCT